MQDENAKRYRETDGTNENGKLNLRVFPDCQIKLFPNWIYRGTIFQIHQMLTFKRIDV